jgi:PhnB protein
MASDGCGAEIPRFEGFSLSVTMPDAEAARRVFTALEAGGQAQMPLGKTFFSPCFGMVTDRFGVGWMVVVNP